MSDIANYGINYSYRDNQIADTIQNEQQYNNLKNQYYTNLANQNYMANINRMEQNYVQGINQAHLQASQNKKNQALVKSAASQLLNRMEDQAGETWGTNINQYASKQMGLDYENRWGQGIQEKIDTTKKNIGDWFKGPAPEATEQLVGEAGRQTVTPLLDEGLGQAIDLGDEAADIGASWAWDAVSQAYQLIKPDYLADQGVQMIADESMNTVADQVAVMSAEQLAERGTETIIKEGTETVVDAAGNVIKEKAVDTLADTAVKEGTETLLKEGTEEVISTGVEEGAKAAAGEGAKAASKGSSATGWTAVADIGLHYLSDDQDDSTYTAGEVATDIGSLALDVLTQDWVGAAMQIYDIGSQWVRRNKLRREERRLKRKKAGELDKAEATASTEYKKSKQYVGYNYQGMGKRSGFGRGALGGYSKYI